MPTRNGVLPASNTDSDSSEWSSDRERGDLVTQTSGVQKTLEGESHKLRQSNRMKNSVVQYSYNEYMAHHYAYMMKVAEDHEPETYTEAVEDP